MTDPKMAATCMELLEAATIKTPRSYVWHVETGSSTKKRLIDEYIRMLLQVYSARDGLTTHASSGAAINGTKVMTSVPRAKQPTPAVRRRRRRQTSSKKK